MANEPQEYFVWHHVTIEVTQTILATSQAEAIAKVKAGEWSEDDHAPGEWLEWHSITSPVAYKARAVNAQSERDG